jgi:hypothetical protein
MDRSGERPAGPPSVRGTAAAIVMHPTSNFMGHYLIAPLAHRGVACLGLNSRYAGNDTMLLVIQDLGAGVEFLRGQGYDKVVLIGNSGCASLSAFYQAQAENLTVETMLGLAAGAGPGAMRRARRALDPDAPFDLAQRMAAKTPHQFW